MAWKKILLFGLFGAVGCLAGWLVGEPYLLIVDAATPADAGRAPSLISKPVAPTTEPPPPSDFKTRLDEAKAKTGDVQISLIWNDTNDLDLHCIDPSGFEISYQQKFSPTGGHLDVDRNAGCRILTTMPVENIYWPKNSAPLGDYHVYVNFYQRCGGGESAPKWKINVLYNGKRVEASDIIVKEPGPSAGPKKFALKFTVESRIELYTPREFEIIPSRTIKVPVAVHRAYYQGPIEVKVENLPDGVQAGKLTIPEGKTEGEIELKATEDAKPTEKSITIKFTATGGAISSSAESALTVAKPAAQFSLIVVFAIGFWTALLAVGLCLALVVGQNYYLGKPLFASGRVPPAAVILGAAAAGFVSGTIGQSLFFTFFSLGVGKLGLVMGWMLLGVLLGWGVSFFIPNLDSGKAALAGLAGGFLGGMAFWIMSYAADLIGRFGGAALLGFCIGLMVAVVEAAFRRAWLEVRFSEREVITVNLGPEPVRVGGDARLCTVWARGAAEIALRYWIRDGKVYCEEVPTKRESTAADGDTRAAGSVTVTVRTATSTEPAERVVRPPALPALPVPPPLPPSVATPQAATPPPRKADAPSSPAPAPPKPMEPDWDDGMPMPLAPPPPARPAAKSILDIEDVPVEPSAPKPTVPVKPPEQGANAPRSPAALPAPKPPAPPAKPPVPAAPAAPAGGPKAGDADACPSCGRKSPGKPGARYCMVCDQTF